LFYLDQNWTAVVSSWQQELSTGLHEPGTTWFRGG